MLSLFKKFKYHTVRTKEHSVQWTVPKTGATVTEVITFKFMINGYGKRKLKYHSYGYSKYYDYHQRWYEKYLIWENADLNDYKQ